MRAGIITGSGTETWPGLDGPVTRTAGTRYGQVTLTAGKAGGAEVLHLARHEAGHRRLSNHVNHRANLAALLAAGSECLISLTVCGAVEGGQATGAPVLGEAELPMALAGYVTDYANGVGEPEPVEALLARMRQSTAILAALVEQALPAIGDLSPAGVVHRFNP
jgi:purine nucleoside phosphorylase